MDFVLKTLRQAVFLGCFLPCIGCSRSDNAEIVKAKAETDAAKADAVAAKADAVAARAELAKVKSEAPPANVPPKPEDKGRLEIGESYQAEFFKGSRVRIWEIRGSAVKEITVRLLIAQNGKAEVSEQRRYEWKTPMMGVKWQLCYLLQTSLTFGVEEKLFPSFSLSDAAGKESSGGNASVIRSMIPGGETSLFLPGLPGNRGVATSGISAYKIPVEPEKQQIVYGELRGHENGAGGRVQGPSCVRR